MRGHSSIRAFPPSSIPTYEMSQSERLIHHAKVGQFASDLHSNRDRPDVAADITIERDDGRRIFIHSVVAGAHSDHFRRILQYRRLPLNVRTDFPWTVVRHVVNFMYDGLFQPHLGEMSDLMTIATRWEMDGLKRLLEDYLCGIASDLKLLPHCMNIVTCPDTNASAECTDKIFQLAATNLATLVRDSRFSHLSSTAFHRLISSPDLAVGSELDVARLILIYLRDKPNYKHTIHFWGAVHFENFEENEAKELLARMEFADEKTKSIVGSMLAKRDRLYRRHRRRFADRLFADVLTDVERSHERPEFLSGVKHRSSDCSSGYGGVLPDQRAYSSRGADQHLAGERELSPASSAHNWKLLLPRQFPSEISQRHSRLHSTDSIYELNAVPNYFERKELLNKRFLLPTTLDGQHGTLEEGGSHQQMFTAHRGVTADCRSVNTRQLADYRQKQKEPHPYADAGFYGRKSRVGDFLDNSEESQRFIGLPYSDTLLSEINQKPDPFVGRQHMLRAALPSASSVVSRGASEQSRDRNRRSGRSTISGLESEVTVKDLQRISDPFSGDDSNSGVAQSGSSSDLVCLNRGLRSAQSFRDIRRLPDVFAVPADAATAAGVAEKKKKEEGEKKKKAKINGKKEKTQTAKKMTGLSPYIERSSSASGPPSAVQSPLNPRHRDDDSMREINAVPDVWSANNPYYASKPLLPTEYTTNPTLFTTGSIYEIDATPNLFGVASPKHKPRARRTAIEDMLEVRQLSDMFAEKELHTCVDTPSVTGPSAFSTSSYDGLSDVNSSDKEANGEEPNPYANMKRCRYALSSRSMADIYAIPEPFRTTGDAEKPLPPNFLDVRQPSPQTSTTGSVHTANAGCSPTTLETAASTLSRVKLVDSPHAVTARDYGEESGGGGVSGGGRSRLSTTSSSSFSSSTSSSSSTTGSGSDGSAAASGSSATTDSSAKKKTNGKNVKKM